MAQVELRSVNGNSWLYFEMSQVPRIGDRLTLFVDDTGDNDLSGTVTDVHWLLVLNDTTLDHSDCVVVTVDFGEDVPVKIRMLQPNNAG